jgi:hypothetical protein
MSKRPSLHQQAVLQELVNWWKLPRYHPDWKNAILTAPAGCGKTFLAKYFTEQLTGVVPMFTATTNSAVEQLAKADVPVFGTLASALGIRPSKGSETVTFRQVYEAIPSQLWDSNLLIIDEASMAGKEMLDILGETPIRVLWLGDKHQLPPVETGAELKNQNSPIFDKGWFTLELTEVVRNSGDNLQFCESLRKQIFAGGRTFPNVARGSSIQRLSTNQFMTDYVAKEANLQEFATGQSKIICWRNDRADRMSAEVRKNLFGDDASTMLIAGDQVILTAPAIAGEFPEDADKLVECKTLNTAAKVNETLQVLMAIPRTLYKISCYYCHFSGANGKFYGYVPTPEGVKKLAAFKKAFIAGVNSGQRKKSDWIQWHSFEECFVKWKYAYAITVHRAQGATIDTVIVDLADINGASYESPQFFYKLAYVAASRVRNQLVLVR